MMDTLRIFTVTLGLAAAALAVAAVSEGDRALQYDLAAVCHGEVWRPVTGHFTHWNGEHLLWDVLAFVALGMLVEWRSRRLLLVTIVASSLVISLAVAVFAPHMTPYRGLSGIDSALYGAVAADLLLLAWRQRSWRYALVPALLWIAFLGRIAYESLTGVSLFVDSVAAGYTPAALAHLVGGMVGAAAAGWHHLLAPATPNVPAADDTECPSPIACN